MGKQIFNYTGSAQSFTVPVGVTSITIDAHGAQGESAGNPGGNAGGMGGRVKATFPVTPSDILTIYVGQQPSHSGTGARSGGYGGPNCNGGRGAPANGLNGSDGGSGGGGTQVLNGATSLVIAGGGAGNGSHTAGGGGGYTTGISGANTINTFPTIANGTGGTQSAGGAAGTSGGSAGVGGVGGNAGGDGSTKEGGGGGGGYFGGGGGGTGFWGGAGGGGGSGHIDASGTNLLTQDAVHSGHGAVVLTWGNDYPPTTIIGGLNPGGSQGHQRIQTSSDDLQTFTLQTTPRDSATSSYAFALATNGSIAVAIDYTSSPGNQHKVMTSSDGGVTWTSRTTPIDSDATIVFNDVSWNTQLQNFVIVGSCSSHSGGLLMTSPDGITWTVNTTFPTAVGNGTCFTYFAGLYIAGTQTGHVITSPDMVTWTDRGAVFTLLNSFVQSGTILVGLGKRSGFGKSTATTPDGITWTERTMPWDGSSVSTGVAGFYLASASAFVCLGTNTNYYFGKSTDSGVTWTGGVLHSSTNADAYISKASVVFDVQGNKWWAAVAPTSSFSGRSLYSFDPPIDSVLPVVGQNWTVVTNQLPGGNISMIVFGGGPPATVSHWGRRLTSV